MLVKSFFLEKKTAIVTFDVPQGVSSDNYHVIDNEGREDKDATIDLSPVSETIDRDVVEEKKRDLGGLFDDLEKKRQDILRKKQELEDAEQEIHNQMNGTAGAIQVCREFLGEVPTD